MWTMEDKEGILSNHRIISKELINTSFKKMNLALQAGADAQDFYDAFVPFLKNLSTLIECNKFKSNKHINTIKDALVILSNIKNNGKYLNNDISCLIGIISAFCRNHSNIQHYTRRQQEAKSAIKSYLTDLIGNTGTTNKIHAFMNDYNRIVYSSAFRRLQDKTQVFPLEKHDYARTRLTHSIEVSSIAAQLGNITAIKLFSYNNNIKKNVAFQIEKILSCAALLHDIGNPPFGHFGEDAIKEFFKENFDNLKVTIYPQKAEQESEIPMNQLCNNHSKELYTWFKTDFTLFDGNAQSFRIAAKTQIYKPGHSLELTGAVLGAIIKYPFSSDVADSQWGKAKFGYFYSEKEEFDTLCDMNVAKFNERNPLVFLLEAADDISYVTSDLDDAIKKGILTLELFNKELANIDAQDANLKSFKDNFEKYFKENSVHSNISPFELTMQRMINDLRIQLIGEVSEAFIQQYQAILKGINVFECTKGQQTLQSNNTNEHCYELIKCIKSSSLVEWIKSLFTKHIYKNSNILKNELMGYEIITCLLDQFTDAVLKLEFKKGEVTKESAKKYAKQDRIFSLISPNFIQTFKNEVNNIDEYDIKHIYYRLRLVVDYISGMTDSYAKEIYQLLKGISY